MKAGLNKQENNYAFIDSQNVNLAIRDQGWKLDWKRLRIYLKDKYKITKVYIFIGYVSYNQPLYTHLQSIGYILVFKPVLELSTGQTKGNVDAELVLQSMIEYSNFDKAIIITGDGDFACLIRYLRENKKLKRVIVPNNNKYSCFIKIEGKGYIDSLTNLQRKLEYKKRAH